MRSLGVCHLSGLGALRTAGAGLDERIYHLFRDGAGCRRNLCEGGISAEMVAVLQVAVDDYGVGILCRGDWDRRAILFEVLCRRVSVEGGDYGTPWCERFRLAEQ